MYSRIIKLPTDKSFFLFGPRGTGKTTWVKTSNPQALYLDLLEAELYNNLLANPGRLENLIPDKFANYIIIDEIQRVPNLLNEIHRLIENNHYKFILTGSNARKIRRGGYNLLAGRALTYYMHPLTVQELGKDFNLSNSLSFGHMPTVFANSDPEKYLESYIKTYLQEEILQEGLTRNLSAFARFLESASFSQGSILNVSEVAREAAIERKTIENYFSILEDLLIGYRIPVFSKKAKRKLINHYKFYYFDAGIYNAIRPKGPLDSPEVVEGVALETLLFQELLAVNSNLELGYKLYYYRTAGGSEVDFILYGERGLKAFEVKRSHKISSTMLKPLKSFMSDYPMADGFLIYGGTKQQREGEIRIFPFVDFLQQLPGLL
jgi:uncharacterized protein